MRQKCSTYSGNESGAWSNRMGRALRSSGRGPRQRAPRQGQHRGWGLDLDRLQVRGLKSGPSRCLEGLRHQSLLVIRLEVPPNKFRFGCFLVKWALSSPQEEWVPAERAAVLPTRAQRPPGQGWSQASFISLSVFSLIPVASQSILKSDHVNPPSFCVLFMMALDSLGSLHICIKFRINLST